LKAINVTRMPTLKLSSVVFDALGRPPVGFEGRIESTLPIGAGLSSSAALEVAVATALCAVADWPLEPLQLAEAAQLSILLADEALLQSRQLHVEVQVREVEVGREALEHDSVYVP